MVHCRKPTISAISGLAQYFSNGLVGADEQCGRSIGPKRLRGLHVNRGSKCQDATLCKFREVRTMSGGLQFDEETSRKVETIYLTPDVVAQRSGVLKALELRKGERVLDIGSGPGLLAYDIATLVGRDGHVCGIDISEAMLTMSRKRCADLRWAEFQRADATTCLIPMIVSMPLYQLKSTNTFRIFR
jgi:Methyltransferase domain